MRRVVLLALLMLGALLASHQAAQAVSFTFTPVDVPFTGAFLTEAVGINPSGQIVGAYQIDGNFHGFLDRRGAFTSVDVPFTGAINTAPLGINPSGRIVGSYFDSSLTEHGFLDRRGVFTSVDVPFTGATGTAAFGISLAARS